MLLGNFEEEIEALTSFSIWNAKKSDFCFRILVWISFSCATFFGSRDSIAFFTSSAETGVKKKVLAKQLFLDLIRFMLGWSVHLSIIPEIVFPSTERVYVKTLYLFIKSFSNFSILGQDFIIFNESNFRTYFDLIWNFRFNDFPKNLYYLSLYMSRLL